MSMTMKNLFLSYSFLFGFFFSVSITSISFASSYSDDSSRPRLVLKNNLKTYFGDLSGTFRFPRTKLYYQIIAGLEDDEISDSQIRRLPKVGSAFYLETGSTENFYPLFSAVVITSSDKVVSAALLDSAGLVIFLRPSPQNDLFIATFKTWAQHLWCSQTPVYVGLGSTAKLNQKYIPSLAMAECRVLEIKTIYLSGYSNRLVN